MNNSPSINPQAGSTLLSLSRFWLLKRKRLASELQGYLNDAQDLLDDLFRAKEGANKSYGTRAFNGNPLILND